MHVYINVSLKKIKILSIKVTHSSSLLRQLILIFYLFHSENKKRRMKRGLHREKKKKINVLSLLGILSLQHRIQHDFLSRGFLEMAGKTCNPSTPCSHTHLFDLTQHLPSCNFFLVVNKFPPLYYLYSLHGIDKVENRITKGCLVLPLVQSPIKKKKKVGINISAFVLLSHVGFHPWWAHIRAPPKHRSFRVQTLPFHYIVLTCDGNQR